MGTALQKTNKRPFVQLLRHPVAGTLAMWGGTIGAVAAIGYVGSISYAKKVSKLEVQAVEYLQANQPAKALDSMKELLSLQTDGMSLSREVKAGDVNAITSILIKSGHEWQDDREVRLAIEIRRKYNIPDPK